MFGKRKERLLNRMEMLVIAAQFVTCTAIGETEGAYDTTDEEEKNRRIAIAAAKANYLFARVPAEIHKTQFNLGAVAGDADVWLLQHMKFQELVVQSLRVQNMVAFGRDENLVEPLGVGILAKFGSQYPDAPDPDSFPALVKKSLNELSQRNKHDLLQAFERRGIHI